MPDGGDAGDVNVDVPTVDVPVDSTGDRGDSTGDAPADTAADNG
jgi:hypothetical protein